MRAAENCLEILVRHEKQDLLIHTVEKRRVLYTQY